MRNLFIAAAVVVALAVPARADVLLDTGGFEGYSIGSIVGQNGWVQGGGILDPSWAKEAATIEVGPGGTKVMGFRSIAKVETTADIALPEQLGTNRYFKVSFDYYREGTGQFNNMYWWPDGANPYYGIAWDAAANTPTKIQPFGSGNGEVDQIPNSWQNIVLLWDLQTGTGNGWVNGAHVTVDANIGIGQINGWYFNDWQTVDPARTPNAVGERSYVDNLRIEGYNDAPPIPEPGTLMLLVGALPLLGIRRRK